MSSASFFPERPWSLALSLLLFSACAPGEDTAEDPADEGSVAIGEVITNLEGGLESVADQIKGEQPSREAAPIPQDALA